MAHALENLCREFLEALLLDDRLMELFVPDNDVNQEEDPELQNAEASHPHGAVRKFDATAASRRKYLQTFEVAALVSELLRSKSPLVHRFACLGQ